MKKNGQDENSNYKALAAFSCYKSKFSIVARSDIEQAAAAQLMPRMDKMRTIRIKEEPLIRATLLASSATRKGVTTSMSIWLRMKKTWTLPTWYSSNAKLVLISGTLTFDTTSRLWIVLQHQSQNKRRERVPTIAEHPLNNEHSTISK